MHITEMPFIRYDNYPNMILRAKVVAIENIQSLISGFGQRRTLPNDRKTIEKLWSDANTAYEDFNNHRSLQSLEQAISKFERVAEGTPESDPGLPRILNNLGNVLCCRFEQLGKVEDINKSIERLEIAVGLTTERDPAKPTCLSSLGKSLLTRFERLGNLSDLNSAIAQEQLATDLTRDGHPDKPMYLNNLGGCLQRRFERLGNISDLDSAIAQHQLALNLVPDGHPRKPTHLSNLGASLQTRFERLGNLSDLHSAITHEQLAVDLTPEGHPSKRRYLNNLGTSLQSRFDRLGNLSDLNSAIAQRQLADKLVSDGHPLDSCRLTNLGNSLERRFKRLGNLSDLDSAITQHQLAVNLIPDGHPEKPCRLNNLRTAFQTRFERLKDFSDLDSAITQQQLSVDLTPDGHFHKSTHLTSLGDALFARFIFFRRVRDVEAAIGHLSASAQSLVGSPITRLGAVRRWIFIASFINHYSLLAAYECAISLMPLVAWLGLPMADRHQHLVQIGEIARDAAATAISLEQYDRALEWLEQGRSIVWNQILQLRTPVDELREVNSDLADRLLRVSRTLDSGIEGNGSLEENSRRYRALTLEWESVLKEIRSLPNFEHFLKPLRASRLRDAAQHGPVVVINIAKQRCDALALIAGIEDVIHIPLPDVTFERIEELRSVLKDQLYSQGVRMRGERAAQKWTDEGNGDDCTDILSELWNRLIKPVLDSLAFSVSLVPLLKLSC
jgi:tetratricopeptide (TPR) repeat protein